MSNNNELCKRNKKHLTALEDILIASKDFKIWDELTDLTFKIIVPTGIEPSYDDMFKNRHEFYTVNMKIINDKDRKFYRIFNEEYNKGFTPTTLNKLSLFLSRNTKWKFNKNDNTFDILLSDYLVKTINVDEWKTLLHNISLFYYPNKNTLRGTKRMIEQLQECCNIHQIEIEFSANKGTTSNDYK